MLCHTQTGFCYKPNCGLAGCQQTEQHSSISAWITNGDQSALFEEQTDRLIFERKGETDHSTITIDASQTFQEMKGFGFTMTGGSAMLIHQMEPAAQKELLDELFLTDGDGIGISYLRISIGSSDLGPYVFSYNDLPEGETDPELEHFSLDPDREYMIPVLRKVLERKPDMKIMGSPWSPPVWMKTNKSSTGGSLMPEYYDAYATYFAKYIQKMYEEGIRVDAISIQNEPLHPGNRQSLLKMIWVLHFRCMTSTPKF